MMFSVSSGLMNRMQRAILGSTPRHFVGHRIYLLFALLLTITGVDTVKRLLLCGVDLLSTTRPIEYIYIYVQRKDRFRVSAPVIINSNANRRFIRWPTK